MDSVLLCRLSALGDIVLTLPVIEAIRAKLPDARIEYLSRAPYGRILHGVAGLDALHLWDGPGTGLPATFQRKEWSLVVDLSGTGRSRRLLAGVRAGRRIRVQKEPLRRFAFVKLRPIGGAGVRITSAVDRMFSCVRDLGIEREGRVPRFGRAAPRPDGPVVIAPGAGRETKRWPAERFAEVIRRLNGEGRRVLLVGSDRERDLLDTLASGAVSELCETVACGDPAELPGVVGRGPVALTNDSGILHVAEACGADVVALFGPTHPRLGFGPLRPGSAVIREDIPCSPCDLHGRDACPKGHHRCMTDLRVERVLNAVRTRIPRGAPA